MSERRPRILCIIDTVGKGGGAEQLMASLLPEMRRQGAEIEVAALFDWPEDLGAEMERDGVPVHRLNLAGPLSVAAAARKLRQLVLGRSYDLFWGHLYYGNFYAWVAKMLAGKGALAVTLHTRRWTHSRPTIRSRLASAVERLVLDASDARIAVSAALKSEYVRDFGASGINVIPNGIDCDRIARDAAACDRPGVRHSFAIGGEEFLIVTPARYMALKGHRFLVEALALLKGQGFRPRLFMCGVGPLQGEIRELVVHEELDGQVTVSPNIPHDRLMPLIVAADLVVIPSLYESFGIAAAEAMALGAACVLTDVDGFRELTAGADCALLVPPGDAQALAGAIDRLRRDPALAAALGERAKAHVCSTFGIAGCARRWIGILEDAAFRLPAASARG